MSTSSSRAGTPREAVPSYQSAGTNVIKSSAGYFLGVCVYVDGTNDAVVEVYDHASAASGDPIFKARVDGGVGGFPPNPPLPVFCENGIVLKLTGTNAEAIVFYS